MTEKKKKKSVKQNIKRSITKAYNKKKKNYVKGLHKKHPRESKLIKNIFG